GQRIATVRQDILDFRSDPVFDIVCTDSFIGRFPHAQWPALAAKWCSVLRPGGHAVTACRLRGESAPAAIGFPEKSAKALHDALLTFAERERDRLGIAPEALARGAHLYAGRHVNHPVRTESDLRVPFEQAGFEFVELTTTSAAGHAEGIRSPSLP